MDGLAYGWLMFQKNGPHLQDVGPFFVWGRF
jgi:hypothetical protein